jgi:hypothetical protein
MYTVRQVQALASWPTAGLGVSQNPKRHSAGLGDASCEETTPTFLDTSAHCQLTMCATSSDDVRVSTLSAFKSLSCDQDVACVHICRSLYWTWPPFSSAVATYWSNLMLVLLSFAVSAAPVPPAPCKALHASQFCMVVEGLGVGDTAVLKRHALRQKQTAMQGLMQLNLNARLRISLAQPLGWQWLCGSAPCLLSGDHQGVCAIQKGVRAYAAASRSALHIGLGQARSIAADGAKRAHAMALLRRRQHALSTPCAHACAHLADFVRCNGSCSTP